MEKSGKASAADKVSNNSIKDNGLRKGPFREYFPIDYNDIKGTGKFLPYYLDFIIGLFISGFYFYRSYPQLNYQSQEILESENQILLAIRHYKNGEFYLGPYAPFGIQLFSLLPNDISVLRVASLSIGASTVFFSYLGARRANMTSLVSIIFSLSLTYMSIFKVQSTQLSIDNLFWLYLTMIIYSWRSIKIYNPFSTKWYLHYVLLSFSLGSIISTKFLGFFTLLWIISLSALNFWNIISDVTLNNKFLIKYLLFCSTMVLIIPVTFFVGSESMLLTSWKNDNIEYSTYMSPEFKSYLRGPFKVTENLHFGSVITLRHVESMGGYLHSHNFNYESGSGEQQVSLSQNETDKQNEWIIEHESAGFDVSSRNVVIENGSKIRLRHKSSGKLLRASTAKPPVSEQDYTNEVSCTRDEDYKGETDELWTIHITNYQTDGKVKPLGSIIKIRNVGHACDLISHDTRLPSEKFTEQEVLCLDPATQSRTHFRIEKVSQPNREGTKMVFFPDENSMNMPYYIHLLTEYLSKQYKYNYYVVNYNQKAEYTPESWPFFVFDKKFESYIWLSSTLGLGLFVCGQLISFLRWNPYESGDISVQQNSDPIFAEICYEYLLGWILHYYPFNKSVVMNLDIILYFPGFYFGLLLLAKYMDGIYKWNRLSILVPVAYVVYIHFY
ncbi:hypothetical protein Kpol_1023p35 [Vanderwaltozyma polyspora DSM 70294]|uniref:dolichyl-phosphate-mannose--protein mannosyltransferase n=1 Tax=Vanderwaltozyma polyspora (strain ATCC 22028 / DSM 70294 / BCRC 21397 / CBS 2163 / NBRC 10782 / NRRL Y-8283 / UCD 57-17) TaxID=436907 RepID=A7TFQ8_VANPO|nr:uncharacterized protein Kpol_1023p35 [Vanderwaltozyma polyspora DSM 70294]EDO18866.1 hypothetical protein Kpol_1023p35 [Vanderwaltozyma polyspora DSM 70294]